jgi:hypothetical protein
MTSEHLVRSFVEALTVVRYGISGGQESSKWTAFFEQLVGGSSVVYGRGETC